MVGVKDNGEPDIGSSTLLHFSVMVMAVTLAMRLMINIGVAGAKILCHVLLYIEFLSIHFC